jgi:NDP-sugar pyrophosphorylase family protein
MHSIASLDRKDSKMTCVILAAGRGIRLAPYTNTTPKPLIMVKGRPIIYYLMRTIEKYFDKVVIVIGYRGEQVRKYFENEAYNGKLVFVEQDSHLFGTFGALLSAKAQLSGDFLTICADNLYDSQDILKLTNTRNSFLIKEVTKEIRLSMYRYAKSTLIPGLENCIEAGAWYLNDEFLSCQPEKVHGSLELGIPHTIYKDSMTNLYKYTPVYAHFWYPVGTTWELNLVNSDRVKFPN